MSIEAMKMALEAMENSRVFVTTREKIRHPEGTEWYDERITTLRVAIEQAEKPVAWMCSDESLVHKGYSRFSRNCEGDWNIPVYTAPPAAPRQWVELTTEEMKEVADRFRLKPPNVPVAFRAIEAKLKEKNT